MPYNGSGVFARLYSWVTDAASSVNITASRMDDEMDGLATGLSNCITRDGQSTVAQNISWNNKKITSLGTATASGDAMSQGASDGRYILQSADGLDGPYGLAVVPSAGACDLQLGTYHYATITTNTVFTFVDPPSTGKAFGFILELTNGGSATLTWPASVKWPNGTAPSLTSSGVDLLAFITRNGGTTWRGQLCQRNSS